MDNRQLQDILPPNKKIAVINENAITVRFDVLTKNDINVLKKHLTLSYQDYLKNKTIVKLFNFIKTNGIIYLNIPRGIPIEKLGFTTICNYTYNQQHNLEFKAKLFENQTLVIEYLMNEIYNSKNLSAGRASAVLNMRAGLGKTFIAAIIISKLKFRTLFITKNKMLAEQAIGDFAIAFNTDIDEAPIRIYKSKPPKRDKFGDVSKHIITIMIINSALMQSVDFFKQYDFIIFDEIHEYCGETFKEIFWKTNRPAVLGLSATTEDHSKGFDTIYKTHLGRMIYADRISGFKIDEVKFNSKVKVIQYHGPEQYTKNLKHESTDMLFIPYMMKQFASDPHRIKLIVNEAERMYKNPDNNIYIFANEIESLKKIYEELKKTDMAKDMNIDTDIFNINLPDEHEIDNEDNEDEEDDNEDEEEYEKEEDKDKDKKEEDKEEDKKEDNYNNIEDNNKTKINILTGKEGKDKEYIGHIRNNSRLVLTTYLYCGTGVSIDKMNAIIFAEPRMAKMKQIVARILRRSGNVDLPREIVDIVDSNTKLKKQFAKRKEAYELYDMKIEIVKHII